MIPIQSMNTRGMVWYNGNQNFFTKKGVPFSSKKLCLFYSTHTS